MNEKVESDQETNDIFPEKDEESDEKNIITGKLEEFERKPQTLSSLHLELL